MTQAYPLLWPAGWPRTAARDRGPYKTELPGALKNLQSQIRLFGGDRAANSLVLSSNVTLGASKPADPGVVAYFEHEGENVAIPCDRWAVVEHNVQAIALTIESMRAIERHGAKHMVKAMFRGFVALSPPGKAWRSVFGSYKQTVVRLSDLDAAYKAAARIAHPDAGGSTEAMADLNRARDEARKELGA